jgi:hypothetical protein
MEIAFQSAFVQAIDNFDSSKDGLDDEERNAHLYAMREKYRR